MDISKIDGVNYVRRTIETADGPTEIEGITVRALRKALEGCDDDALVFYMAELTEEARKVDLLLGVIAGVGPAEGVVALFGPEGVRAIKAEAEKTGPPPTCTTDHAPFDPTLRPDGQQKNYIVLCEEDRKKGFVRPYREKYIHVGVGGSETDPDNPAKHGRKGCGCGVLTRMGREIAETYARDPKFYGSTFCVGCGKHLPVEEFVWEDGTVVGS